jgi:PhnB protein
MASIAPWLAVSDGAAAVAFYQKAFGATRLYTLDGAPGEVMVARLSVDGADFWLQHDPDVPRDFRQVRMIITTDDPDTLFAKALAEGGTEVNPMEDAHGWHVGRLSDPFGHHWEIGREIP